MKFKRLEHSVDPFTCLQMLEHHIRETELLTSVSNDRNCDHSSLMKLLGSAAQIVKKCLANCIKAKLTNSRLTDKKKKYIKFKAVCFF